MKRKMFLSPTAVVLLAIGLVAGGLLAWLILAEPGGSSPVPTLIDYRGSSPVPAHIDYQGTASVPALINYQGTLLDPATGNPVPGGEYQFVFSIYDVEAGGDPLWQETQQATVQDGLFSVLLGSVETLSASLFDGSPRYLGVKVGEDAEMTPRQLLASAPYAFQAEELDGMGSDDFVHVTGDDMTGTLNVQGTDTGVIGTGSTYGLYGSGGTHGIGVYGWCDANNYGYLGGLNRGVEGYSTDGYGVDGYSSNSIGVRGRSDSGSGVYGEGDTGVYGTGYTGVQGDGEAYGVYGSSGSFGVKGDGGSIGVYGDGGWTGVYGDGGTTGVEAYGEVWGVYGVGDKGVNGQGATWDFYASGPGANYGPFTGAHEVKLSADFPEDIEPGMIVSVTGEVQMRMIDGEVSYSSNLPTVQLSETLGDSRVLGAFIAEAPLGDDHWYISESGEGERFGIVNALGEGRVWVTNVNGDIEAGDYIITSAIAGYGQRQDDDLLHSYTLGKAIEDVDWSEVIETVEFNGHTYKAYPIAVVYTSG